VFVTASLAVRARRRWLELQAKGTPADRATVEADMAARDEADRARIAAPLRAAADAIEIDTTGMDAETAFATALAEVQKRLASPKRIE
jgi:cytidylate kinase